ncbi:MAG TPA: hypothetical protein VKB46_24715 [Pyrinomonadaceae bacterium]|nr:hypothetical protein [Pyrinomonadaceae bacterium]
MNLRYASTMICAIVVLTSSLAPCRVNASNSGTDHQTPIRLYVNDRFGPIGTIRNSLAGGAVAVDGRLAQDNTQIWGGELIKVIGNSRVAIAVDSIGKISLSPGSSARFATAHASADESSYNILVAYLVAGSAIVKLNPEAGAYIEAGRSSFSASRGASFNIKMEEGRGLLTDSTGSVYIQDQPAPQDVNIRVVDELGRPVASGSQFSVRARSTRQIQVQVTDKNDKPLPDLPVLFSLGDPCLGSLGVGALAAASLVQKTDNRGIAAVPLAAGAARCTASITAKIEGTNASVSIQVSIQANVGFWTTQNTVLVAAGAAAAGVVTGVVVSNSGSSNNPITPVPPPGVKP